MYCKYCGHENPDYANYCGQDGTPLSTPQGKQTYKAKAQGPFCPSCGIQNDTHENYCGGCGHTLIKYTKDQNASVSKAENEQLKKKTPIKLPNFSIDYLKKAIIPVLVSFVLLFVFAALMHNYNESLMNNLYAESMGDMEFDEFAEYFEEETGEEMPRLDKFYGMTDFIMASNMQSSNILVEIRGTIFGDNGQVKMDADIDNGSLFYLIFGFIALFAGGILLGILIKKSNLSRLYSALTFALLYGVGLGIISFFSGFSYKNRIRQEDYMNLSMKIVNDYSFFSSLFLGFLFAFVFAGLALLFTINYRKATGHLRDFTKFGEALHQAFTIVVRGGLLVFIFVFTMLLIKFEKVKEMLEEASYMLPLSFGELLEMSYLFITTVAVQLTNYIWNLLHFAPLKLIGKDNYESSEVSYSIFGLKFKGESAESEFAGLEFMLSDANVDLLLKLGVIIPILFFIWAGFRIARNPEKLIPQLLVFSGAYALLMAVLASLSSISIDGSMFVTGQTRETIKLYFGVPVIQLFFTSFIISLIFAYGGTWIRRLIGSQRG